MELKQKVEIMEMMTNIETANKYKIKNSMGQDVYKAKEKSDFCTRQCCGPIRCFQMEITDNTGREVIHLDRPLNCATVSYERVNMKNIGYIVTDIFSLIINPFYRSSISNLLPCAASHAVFKK